MERPQEIRFTEVEVVVEDGDEDEEEDGQGDPQDHFLEEQEVAEQQVFQPARANAKVDDLN